MFLNQTIRRNPEIIRASFMMHQRGQIEPDSYVIDVDTFLDNASGILKEAGKRGIKLFFMLKQVGRNPYLAQKLLDIGYGEAVAVDYKEAKVLMDNHIPLGNVGHLVQIPSAQIKNIVQYGPYVITVFSEEKIRQINDAAKELNKVQKIILRVYNDSDQIYSGQEAGFHLNEVGGLAARVQSMYKNVKIIGVTSFPCYLYNDAIKDIEPTENLATVKKAAELLESLNIVCEIINTPSAACIHTLKKMEIFGGNCGEPGHGLTGTTPMHAAYDLEEIPCVVYVSEISHNFAYQAYCFGGGHYRRSSVKSALIGKSLETAATAEVTAPSDESIDYHFGIKGNYEIGETVVMSFRYQIFVTRSNVVLVEGLKKNEPRIAGIYDAMGKKL